MILESLKYSWDKLLYKSQAEIPIGEVVFCDLVRAYSHPSRHYHNLGHIKHLLTLSEQFQDNCDRWIVLQFAAWFHDYIYDTKAKNNEIQTEIDTFNI